MTTEKNAGTHENFAYGVPASCGYCGFSSMFAQAESGEKEFLMWAIAGADVKSGSEGAKFDVSTRSNPATEFAGALRRVCCFLIVPNLPFWVASRLLGPLERSLFNLDYLAIALAGLFLPTAFWGSAFVVVFLLDIFRSCACFYYFSTQDLISSARFVSQLPGKRTVAIGICLVCMAFTWTLLAIRIAGPHPQRNRMASGSALIGVILLLVTEGAVANSSPLRRGDGFTRPKLANSAGWALARAAWSVVRQSNLEDTATSIGGSSAELLTSLHAFPRTGRALARPDNVVLILVESYGLVKDPRIARMLQRPFFSQAIAERYEVRTGEVSFHGSTVSGEFRELCGIVPGMGPVGAARQMSPQCLPSLLDRLGYETEAIHGFTGYMFDRRTWYRDLGFRKELFWEELKGWPGMHTCPGAFPGVCDADIARMIGDQLATESAARPQFIYWVTLNSHLPIQLSDENRSAFGCNSPHQTTADLALCNFLEKIYEVNAAAAETASRATLQPTEFLIVGDHAPPFLARSRRAQFSQQAVPFVHLWPKFSSPGIS